jgi:hypothetical protein
MQHQDLPSDAGKQQVDLPSTLNMPLPLLRHHDHDHHNMQFSAKNSLKTKNPRSIYVMV